MPPTNKNKKKKDNSNNDDEDLLDGVFKLLELATKLEDRDSIEAATKVRT